MIVVSHEMSFVHRVAGRLVMMDDGRIVEQGAAGRGLRAAEGRTHAPLPAALVKENAWIEWLTVDELDALERLFREAGAETVGDMPEADQAKAAAIYYSAESRRLSGAPKDSDLPRPAYDIQAAYERSKRAMPAPEPPW
jgi:ABC-type multidrug transport system ATPase subunit